VLQLRFGAGGKQAVGHEAGRHGHRHEHVQQGRRVVIEHGALGGFLVKGFGLAF